MTRFCSNGSSAIAQETRGAARVRIEKESGFGPADLERVTPEVTETSEGTFEKDDPAARCVQASSTEIYRYCKAMSASGMLAVVAQASALVPGTNLALFLAHRSLPKACKVLLDKMQLDSHG